MIRKYLILKSRLLDAGLLLMVGAASLAGPISTQVQFLPNTDYLCRFGTDYSMLCKPPVVSPPPAPVPPPPPAPAPLPPPPPPPVVSTIKIGGIASSYTVDSVGTKIIVPFTVAFTNFTPVKVEISRDAFAPFYTWTAPPWGNTYCINCFRPDEPLPRDTKFTATATDAAGKVLTQTILIHVATGGVVTPPAPPPPPSPSLIKARQLPTAETLEVYVGTGSTAPTSQMKPVKAITASSGAITWTQYAAHNNLCLVRVALNGQPPDNKLLPQTLTVAYVDGSSETLPVAVWVSEGNLNDPAQRALLGMTTAQAAEEQAQFDVRLKTL